MGRWKDLNTEDSLPMRFFLTQYFEKIVESCETSKSVSTEVTLAFNRAVQTHLWGISEPIVMWGWKNPRWMWIIPFLVTRFPGVRFVHLVRDGRDMGLTKNKLLLKSSGDRIVGEGWRNNIISSQLTLWAK
ncbi:MAG: hypothetical protein ACUZ8O_15855 [Candidatus Anammoxibacter sp.]